MIYRELRNLTSDKQMLQSELDCLSHWANTWQLRFNKEKCEAMRITHSHDNSSTDYTLGTTLKDVKSFKDLELKFQTTSPGHNTSVPKLTKPTRSWDTLGGLLEQLIQVLFHCSTIHW